MDSSAWVGILLPVPGFKVCLGNMIQLTGSLHAVEVFNNKLQDCKSILSSLCFLQQTHMAASSLLTGLEGKPMKLPHKATRSLFLDT